MNYHFIGEEEVDSPSLIYYQDVIEENIKKAINLSGGAERLWPHIKTHKTAGLLKLQMERGISRFKCATIAEAELCAIVGASDVLVAYPLIGPKIGRFAKLREKFAGTVIWATGDNLGQLDLLGKAVTASLNKNPVNTLIDVNLGMNRTGVSTDKLEEFYQKAIKIDGLSIKGFHCYDGHIGNSDLNERKSAVSSATGKLWAVKKSLEKQGYEIPVFIMGGTPTFPCHRETPGVYLSPGTVFVSDYEYMVKFPDMDYTPGAAILTRVVSHPGEGLFTVDTGCKAISSDKTDRGIIADLPEAKAVGQSEEHWVWKLDRDGMFRGDVPPIGTVLYIIPTHICPCTVLYPGITVIKNGKQADYWEVGARNRKLTV
jgi:D-serine deaminase-like pyridoxal phosphate-dependent protein